MSDRSIVRNLAAKYYEYACGERNQSKVKLHKSVNDKKMIRPAVCIDELPWHEMNINGKLDLRCEDNGLRGIEHFFRYQIFKYEYFPADMYLTPYYPVGKAIRSTGIGVRSEEDILKTDERNNIVSHSYHDKLQTDEDIEKLQFEKITYDREATYNHFNYISDILADIMPVKITGAATGYGMGAWIGWDTVSFLKGADNLLYDLAERPEFMRKLISKLADITIDSIRQYDEMGLYDPHAVYNHCTPALTDDLEPPADPDQVRAKNVWGRGLAQILGAVSPAMHDEFEVAYAQKILEPFGLVYYGCCEPLDNKIEILRKIKNLRKISITPWADIDRAAEAIGSDYVIAAKPNPAFVGVNSLDTDTVKQEITRIINACKRNGTSCDIVLKDISTVKNHPENIIEWEKTVMDIVANA